ncbi:MAG: tyrosine-type recombinase/integrase [Actinomycetes bacterium]
MDDRYPARVTGPLASHVAGFRAQMARLGYTPRYGRDHAYVLVHLSRWLEDEGLAPAELTAEQVARFARARRAAGYRNWVTARSLRLLLGYLRAAGVIPPELPGGSDGPVGAVLAGFRRYLSGERRLASRTVDLRAGFARQFLMAQVAGGELDLGRLEPAAVIAFASGQSGRYGTGSVKQLATALRSLLRYLFVSGVTVRDLSGAVPAVAGWRMSGLPPAEVGDRAVAALLGSCDRSTAMGCRDFAVLTVMARLALRAQEISALCLEDVDWRAGELVVHGKGGRIDRLPLPADAGAALAGYLQHGRRASRCREVFICARGPDAPMSRQTVVMVPRRASERAGVATVGAHRLRHRAAGQILRQGGSLAEAAQLLRHHSEATTAIYAKVDQAALAAVIRPWPGV